MIPRVLECSHCGGPVGYRAPFCPYCRSALTWTGPPSVERGGPILSRDYRHHEITGALVTTTIDHGADGALVSVTGPFRVIELDHPARDTVTSVEGVVLDRGGALGVVVRAFADGALFTGYVASVIPAFRAFRLSRNVEGAEVSTMRALSDWEACEAVRPLGEVNVIELRAADSLLEVHVNGQRMLSLVDSGLAFGASGFRVFSLEQRARVLVRRLDVHEAVAGK